MPVAGVSIHGNGDASYHHNSPISGLAKRREPESTFSFIIDCRHVVHVG